jgi:hypothetical protein
VWRDSTRVTLCWTRTCFQPDTDAYPTRTLNSRYKRLKCLSEFSRWKQPGFRKNRSGSPWDWPFALLSLFSAFEWNYNVSISTLFPKPLQTLVYWEWIALFHSSGLFPSRNHRNNEGGYTLRFRRRTTSEIREDMADTGDDIHCLAFDIRAYCAHPPYRHVSINVNSCSKRQG